MLRDMGWNDFLSQRRPVTNSSVFMAAHAFTCLCLEDEANKGFRIAVLRGVLAFLRVEKGTLPKPSSVQALKKLMDENPVNCVEVHKWFGGTYP